VAGAFSGGYLSFIADLGIKPESASSRQKTEPITSYCHVCTGKTLYRSYMGKYEQGLHFARSNKRAMSRCQLKG
jgi:hypothetical protein